MKPLDGLLVIALEQAVAAPLCSARLAEAGARVIKIERAVGDFARGYDEAAKGESSYFVWLNQGKESIVLDIKDAADLALLERMIAKADVFLQNLAPGATARMGIDSATLRARHPRLVTCDISGYGEAPEVAHLKAYDFLIQGESGLVAVSGGENELGRIGVSLCDIGAGVTAHAAILEALLLRARSGEGAAVKVSLFDVAAEWMTVPFIHGVHGAGPPARQGLRHPSIAPYGAYETSDGALTLLSIQNEREWQRFCTEALGAPELAVEPRFVSNTLRVANREAMEAAVSARTKAMTAEEFRRRLADAAIAYGAVNDVSGLARHAALRRREVTGSGGRALDIPAAPVIWADHDRPDLAGAPAVGQDSARIRAEFGGSNDGGN